jgi:glycosyltransferase involved in cell wall biosynthesis
VTAKTVYLEPLWNLHAFQHQMLAYPPSGYTFLTDGFTPQVIVRAAARWHAARALLKGADIVLPTSLAKAWAARWKSPPAGTVLTYAVDHLVFRREPWIVEVEYAAALVGIHARHLRRFRHLARSLLSSPQCRRIVCWSEAGRRSLNDLGVDQIGEKTDVVYYGVPSKLTTRPPHAGPVTLLFVGSGTSGGAFEGRGSEIFEVFVALRERFRDIELVVRSDVPSYIRRRYGALPGLRLMDRRVPKEVLEREFLTADIFLFPSYHTLASTILEAMSYGLPVVTIDSWANAEYVQDGITGLVVPRPRTLPAYCEGTQQPGFLDASFREAASNPDPDCIDALTAAVTRLIEQPDLRYRMGRAARYEVERGKFSLRSMNADLSRTFDHALAASLP